MVQAIGTSVYGLCWLAMMLLADSPKPYPPVNVATGVDSMTEHISYGLASDPVGWQRAWNQYRGNELYGRVPQFTNNADSPPAIDFSNNFVVVIFGGYQPFQGYRVVDSFEAKKQIHLRVQPIQQNVGVVLNGQPYAFIVLKRTDDPISVEFPGKDQNGNLAWTQVVRLGGAGPRNRTGNGSTGNGENR